MSAGHRRRVTALAGATVVAAGLVAVSASAVPSAAASSESEAAAPAAAQAPAVARAPLSLAGPSLRSYLTQDRFYFVVTDRFDDGNPANDRGALSGGPDQTGYDPTDKGFFHGGDLQGLTTRLDYIKGLGTTAIWITPVFTNRVVQGTAPNVSAGYHGYWITDFTHVDPHLGTHAQLQAFIAAAHARGIKVFFDIVANHTADVISYAQGYSYRTKAAYPYLDAQGRPFDDASYADSPSFPALNKRSFPYTPVLKGGDRTVKVPAWLNDVTMYHNRGNSTFAGESLTEGDVYGLDDLFTERPQVLHGMEQIYDTWVRKAHIDGFRIDTVQHVNMQFWQHFAPHLLATAHAAGKPRFMMFGEVANPDPSWMSQYTTSGRLPAVLDFGFQAAAREFASQSGPGVDLRALFAQDDLYTDADSNVYNLPTFLGNHDMGRFGYFLQADNPGASASDLLARDELGNELMYFSRGMPVVYYGDEQGFTGHGGDQDSRLDMFPSKVASYNDNVLIGTTKTTATSSFDRSSTLYRFTAALAKLTAANPALRDGAQIARAASDGPGVFAMSRIDRRQQVEYVVALNNATTAKTASIPTYSAGMRFSRIWGGTGSPSVATDARSRLTVTVPALSAEVLRATASVAPSRVAPKVTLVTPARSARVTGRTLLDAQVSGTGFAQVTFAVRVGNGPWKVVGTDDNPSYRAYYDTSGLSPGTPISVEALVTDNAGHVRSSAPVTVRVG